MRADAQRNRDKIVEAARLLFREKGYDAPLDEIAKTACVGAGTLYRHFPNRESLMDAVMQSWVDGVATATDKALASEGAPRDVLVAWLEAYVRLISTYRGNPAKITAAMGDSGSPIAHKCATLKAANDRVIEHLGDALRDGVDGVQMARLAGGVAAVADQSQLDEAAVHPLLEVVADGMLV